MRLPRLLDDFAKVGTSALMVIANIRHEARGAVQARASAAVQSFGVASRAELDAALDLARKAREAQEILDRRVAALEQAAGKN